MWIKICCIQSIAEARLALAAGANAIGLVAAMPSGPGPIADERIREIARWVRDESITQGDAGPETFLLTARTEPDAVVDHVDQCETTTVQLVDAVPLETYAALRTHHPRVRIVQVIHVEDGSALAEAARVAPYVDRLLLDSGRPRAAVKVLGGTGLTHDWAVSRRLVDASAIPVILAGGLRADNVREAVTQVRPFGLDLCSGVRVDGKLDPSKLAAFMTAARARDSA